MTQLPKFHAIVASPSSELLSLPSYWVLGYGATARTGGRVPRIVRSRAHRAPRRSLSDARVVTVREAENGA